MPLVVSDLGDDDRMRHPFDIGVVAICCYAFIKTKTKVVRFDLGFLFTRNGYNLSCKKATLLQSSILLTPCSQAAFCRQAGGSAGA